MNRRCLLVIPLVLASCGAPGDLLKPEAMKRVDGWALAASSAGGDKWKGRYTGAPTIEVELTRMSSQTVAFSAVQDWRPEPGKVAFYHGRYFGIASAEGADTRVLSKFVSAFEKLLPQ